MKKHGSTDRHKRAKRLTRGEAIVLFCRECFGYDGHRGGNAGTSYVTAGKMVKECEDSNCPLWPFRNGPEESRNDSTECEEESAVSEHATLKRP